MHKNLGYRSLAIAYHKIVGNGSGNGPQNRFVWPLKDLEKGREWRCFYRKSGFIGRGIDGILEKEVVRKEVLVWEI